ncbi:MAG: L-rhamnose isomerase [Isosphaeraceae bacterium]
MSPIETSYRTARERYAALGVDTEAAMGTLAGLAISIHCWQGDDVGGFEGDRALSGGIQATGNYPGKARTPDELRGDAAFAFSWIPGRHRFNLHASYAEIAGKPVDRDALGPEHFQGWIQWAREQGLGLDFNPTFFSHPWADDGFTLSHRDEGRRRFWIEHGRACRRIGAAFGRALGTPCVTNIWIPDGSKDTPVDRKGPRERLLGSLDAILDADFDRAHLLDAVEGKLFGLGLESYTVGSHEFYLGYAVRKGILLCLDAGHYHPTESLADKISAVLAHLGAILLHVSRGVRWDSDHVVVLDDPLRSIAEEAVRGDYLGRIRLGLDFFDASINRVAAWVIGARALQKALLEALLQPIGLLRELERSGDFTARLAWLEEAKSLPSGDVWRMFCERLQVPAGMEWLDEVRRYEREVLATRPS